MFGIIVLEDMSLVGSLLYKESIRNQNMIAEYEKELLTLPKGSVKVKVAGHNSYYYLNYRNGKKIVSKYIGTDEENVSLIKEQLARRHHIELMLKKLKQEQQQIKKLEAML